MRQTAGGASKMLFKVICILLVNLTLVYNQTLLNSQFDKDPWITDFVHWWGYARIPIATFIFGTSILTWLVIYQNREKLQLSENDKHEDRVPHEDKSPAIKVFYGTQTGQSQYFAELLKEEGIKVNISFEVINMKDCEAEEVLADESDRNALCVFIISTYSEGDPPESAKWFCKYLREASDDFRVQKSMLKSLRFTVFGLGNSIYEDHGHYNTVAKSMDSWLRKLSASCVFPNGFGDDNIMRKDHSNIADDFKEWTDSLLQFIKQGEVVKHTELVSSPDEKTSETNEECKTDKTEIKYESDSDNETGGGSCKNTAVDEQAIVDLEDIGNMMNEAKTSTDDYDEGFVGEKGATESREMVTPLLRKSLEKQGYKLIGSHSGVKICRWTKSMMRGRGGCYKHTFYGIESHRCMETTPSLACANKCVFCWRHHTNPVGTEWKWKMDPAEDIVNGALESHYKMIKQCKGIPGVKPDKFEEAMNVQHCALSLVGEPIMYPEINTLIDLLHSKSISTFLVTNAQFPDAIKALSPVTQLYVSVDAATKESLKKIDRPLFKDFWQRFLESLKSLSNKGQRTVYRLTLVKAFNTEEIESYAKLVELGQPGFIEIKGVTYCGDSKASSLTMENVPWHEEVVTFVKEIAKSLPDYMLASEHEHSNCVLLVHKRFFVNNEFHTWIDYPKYHELMRRYTESNGEEVFSDIDYMAPTPHWAVFGDENRGFDPEETRWHRKKKKHDVGGC